MEQTHILVAVDGTEASVAALRVAACVANCSDRRVIVCHAVAPVISTFAGPTSAKFGRETAVRDGEQVLAHARRLLGAKSADFELLEGDPPEAICRRAEELGCELIVVGSRGLRLFDRLLTRSVSSAVVANAPCSVLAARLRSRSTSASGAQT